ncbi:MAG: OmpA family protein [Deltaproteobacteria bacterium]|nr:OmpA family protein [Deltaproteobacteria bacterium]
MPRLWLLIAVMLSLPSSGALAAEDLPLRRGIDPISTKLSSTIDGFLTSEGARTSPGGSYKLELAFDYASGLMSLKVGDEKIDELIRHRLDLHLLGAYAITDWAEAAIDVPFTVFQQNGFAALRDATGFDDPAPSKAGLGDVRVLGKLRLLREDRHLVTVSALAELRLPTGADSSFLGERSVLVYPRAMLERTFLDRLRVGLDAGYRYRALPGRYLNLYVGDELALAISGAFELPRVLERKWSVMGELLVSTPSRAPFTATSSDALKTPLELLLGLRVQVYRNLWASLGGGTGFLGEAGFGREGLRLFAMVGYTRVWHDRDGDGIADDEDKCPDAPEDRDGFEDGDGCPDPDNDGDGVPDGEDGCPLLAGPKKLRGCPDADGDGIPDPQDKCPQQPGPVENEGCPDSDGDEVPDHEDKCPQEPGPAANDGCPGTKPWVVFEKGKLTLKDSVHFDTGKASIKQNSLPILDELAKILTEHLEVKQVRIEGHTDNVGGAALNQDLSQRRAQSVVDYLVSKGLDGGRLSAKGFGEDKPVAPNTTPLGRAKNRRVECNVLE